MRQTNVTRYGDNIVVANHPQVTHQDDNSRRTLRFELIARITKLIGSDLNIDSLLQRAADAMHEVLKFPAVDIPLLDPADPSILVVHIRGGSYKQDIQQVDRLSINAGLMGAAVRERRTILVNDVANDSRYVKPPHVKAPLAELVVPIMLRGDVLGVLNVEGHERFDDLDCMSLQIIAEILAMAIGNAKLMEESRVTAVRRERGRIAIELHDHATQMLTAIHLSASALPDLFRTQPTVALERAGRLQQLAQSALTDMRGMLRELTPVARPLSDVSKQSVANLRLAGLYNVGLAGELAKDLVTLVPDSIQTNISDHGYVPQRLERELELLKICHEAIINCVKHARATRLQITLAVDGTGVSISICDNGIGMTAQPQEGLGLGSIRDRVLRLSGELRYEQVEPCGTRVTVRVVRMDRTE
jgi:signal transduction histidine kinase